MLYAILCQFDYQTYARKQIDDFDIENITKDFIIKIIRTTDRLEGNIFAIKLSHYKFMKGLRRSYTKNRDRCDYESLHFINEINNFFVEELEKIMISTKKISLNLRLELRN
ncbi:uncharacterized protein VNE69_07146 [Vairimorpha necatrix]|uniref:Uncharacterized protein n=1 Tax=Vairimorpha necatrix TaxID=6039 RepID=A0AAX4JDP2_9MICR